MGNSKWPFTDDGNPGDANLLKELNDVLRTSPEDTDTQQTLPRPLPPLQDGEAPDTRSEREALAELNEFFSLVGDAADITVMSLADYDRAKGNQPNTDQTEGN